MEDANKEIAKLRAEIHNTLQSTQKKKRVNWASPVVTTILAVLAFVSLAQAVQSANILSKVESGDVQSTSGSSSKGVLPSNLQDLPNMVGGC